MSIEAHIAELSPAYRIFDGLADPAHRAAAAGLFDFLLDEGIALPEDFSPAPEALACLRDAVKTAHPDRKCISYILAKFSQWWNGASEQLKLTILEYFPALAPAAQDLDAEGMRQVLEASELDARVLRIAGSYAMTNQAIIRATAKLGLHAAQNGQADLFERLAKACPAEKMEESKEAERLFPAAAKVPDALGVIAAIAERNISSALGASLKLSKLARTPEYLADFQALVESIGPRAIGFAVDTLPGYYSKYGSERANAFILAAAECGRNYGSHAAQAYLEGKTKAAREAI